jgi:hypothetical protein
MARAGAFTILEMLVAVAAVALIGVGLAKLFADTGNTVRIGRRASAMNDYAALIRRTIQSDLDSVSRDGFMIMKHREVNSPANTGILLSPTDPNRSPRARRVDEWLFFTQGRFTSLREPRHPSKYPQGYSARVYYGHGLQRGADRNGLEPSLLDDNLDAPTFGAEGPNQFASDWILLRHLAVLAPPNSTDLRAPKNTSAAIANEWADSPVQIGLNPAAYSLFRNEDLTVPDLGSLPATLQPIPWTRSGESASPSWLSSGIVDVVAMDLSQVRQRVMSTFYLDPKTNSPIKPLSLGVSDLTARPKLRIDQNPQSLSEDTSLMKQWMMFALPGGSRVGFPDPAAENNPEAPEGRMRCEKSAPNFLGTSTSRFPDSEAAYKRDDQLMLSASNFVPGCTEFIVEWSFGERFGDTDPRVGQLIWHGLPRYLDIDDDGVPDTSVPEAREADFYMGLTSPTPLYPIDQHGVFLPRTFRPTDPNSPARLEYVLYPTKSELIHYPPTAASLRSGWPAGKALYSCFGYIDPTYEQLGSGQNPFDRVNFGADSTAPVTAPWPWPKFVRITMSLVDPADPDNEQTYQFVLPVPERKTDGV